MAISFNSIPSNIAVPLFYAEVDNSMANTGANNLKALIIGQMTDGTATAGEPVLVSGDNQGKDYFGQGSMLALMNTAFRNNNSVGELWAIPLADPSGGSKASGTFTLSGTANEAGVIYAYIGATRLPVAIAQGDSASKAAVALANAINANRDLPMTAQAADGEGKSTVTVQAKNAGAYGNDIKIFVNYNGVASGEVLPDGLGVEVSKVSGGAGVIDFSVIKNAMGSDEYDFIAFPYADNSLLGEFKVLMNDATGRWSAMSQLYGHVYCAKRGTAQELVTFVSGLNDQHLTVVAVEDGMPQHPAEILGAYVGKSYGALQIDPARPTQSLELTGITPARAGQRFTLAEKQTLLTSGVATNSVTASAVRIERAVTTYQKNAYGVDDTSYLDSETLHTLAYVIRQLKSVITSKFPRHKLANDGTRFGAGQAIVTPNIIRGEILAVYSRLENLGIVENFEAFKKALIVERSATDPNRVDVLLPPDLVNGLRIFATLVQFRLQYE
mgnify:CR=1 FL=1